MLRIKRFFFKFWQKKVSKQILDCRRWLDLSMKRQFVPLDDCLGTRLEGVMNQNRSVASMKNRGLKQAARLQKQHVLIKLWWIFFQVYLNQIMSEVKKCGSRLSNLDQELLGRLTDLQTGFSSKLALPTVHAFPLLMRLARTWQGFQVSILTHYASNCS